MATDTPPSWDLSDLYHGPHDPALEQDHRDLMERARAFEERYRGRIAPGEGGPAFLRQALDDYEGICRLAVRPSAYAGLLFAADTTDPAGGALVQRTQERDTALNRHLIFFDLEIGRIPEERFAPLAADERLAPYRYYLERERRLARFRLTEPEEKVIDALENTGARALRRLHAEVASRSLLRLRLRGEERDLTLSEATALLYEADRETRRAAAAALTESFRAQAHVGTFLYNHLLGHKETMDRLRGYEYPEQERHLGNDVDRETADTVAAVCAAGYGIVADFYRLKRRLLGLDELTHYDRYAPLDAARSAIPFAEAREIVLDAFGRFSPHARRALAPFFERRWIDAAVRPGKRGGAFCSYVGPDRHGFVFLNYTHQPRDVMTLAHELGHALHGALASSNHFLHFYPSLALAETASVFGEMLVFEDLRRRLADPRERLALLAGKLEDTFATVFRQVAMYRFEQAAHRKRRAEGELSAEAYGQLWQQEMQAMFGDSLRLGDDHACWWLAIPHVFGSPFYVYAYAFGELMVLSLYARFRTEGDPFVPRYLDLLALGGSRSPADALAAFGIDIRDPAFWEEGIRLIGDMVSEARELAAALPAR